MKKLLLSLFLLLPLISKAEQNSFSITPKAILSGICFIDASDIALGNIGYTGYSSGTGNITVLCTRTTTFSIAIATGSNGTSGNRYLKHTTAADKIPYTICKGPGFNGSACSSGVWWTGEYVLNSTGTGFFQTFKPYVYTVNSYTRPGNYSDSTSAIITF